MKSKAVVFGTLLMLLCLTGDGDALMLDYPHNVDNGIKCYHCHSADPSTGDDYWWDGYGGSDLDGSVYNWVCYNRCHAGDNSSDPSLTRRGPEKVTHSTTTTGSDSYSFTTECIACHDPHFQEQIRWAGGAANEYIYVAKGQYEFTVAGLAQQTNAADIYDPDNPGFVEGGAYDGLGAPPDIGTSTVGVTLYSSIPGEPLIFDPATANVDWVKKGEKTLDPLTGLAWNERAGDHSRGLILVVDIDPNEITTTRTHEIVDMVPQGANDYIMKVKGDIVTPGRVGNTVKFGVVYGNLLGYQVKTPEFYLDDQNRKRYLRRPVKFFSPKSVLDDGSGNPGAGGPADLTPGATEPVGMCQVCHTMTSSYKSTVEEIAHHDADGRPCDECHQMVTGGEPVVTHAPTFIDIGAALCADCHIGYDTNPDLAHIGRDVYLGCQTCHTDPAVDTYGAPYLRTTDGVGTPAVEQRVPYISDGTIHAAVDCTVCHNATYGSGDYTLGHPATDVGAAHDTAMTAQASCVDACHGTLTNISPGSEIVTNSEVPGGHADKCELCHLTVTPSPVELTDAARPDLQPHAGTLCGACHTAYFDDHNHDHTGQIGSHVDCNGCHDAIAGSAADAITAPYVGDTEVHYNAGNPCQTCHDPADGTPVGSAATGWGATWSSTLTGDCTTCHGAYFTSHTHHGSAENDVTYNGVNDKTLSGTSCSTCHQDSAAGTASLDTWNGIIIEHDTNGPKDGDVATCAKCHSYDQTNGVYNTMEPVTVANAISSGNPATCATCHTAKAGPSAVDHGGHIASHFLWGGDCDDCHSANPGNPQEEVVLEIHSDNCALCHYDPDGVKDGDATNNFDRIVGDPTFGVDGDATEVDGVTWTKSNSTCETCHITATPLISKPSIHHDTANAVATPTSACTTACHNTTTGHAGDHFTVPLVGNVAPCQSCHTATAPTNGNNVPVNPTADPTGDKVHDYCTTCHVVGAGNIIELVDPIPLAYVTTMDNPIGTATNNGGGPCSDCHTAYFDSHTHGHDLTSVVNPCEGCHGATAAPFVATGGAHATNGCATCHDLDATPTGLIITGSSADGATGTEDCQGCHTGYFDSHDHGTTGGTAEHLISLGASSCGTIDCHDADGGTNAPSTANPPYLGVGEVHEALSCGSCHDLTTDGSPKALTAAANWNSGSGTWGQVSGDCEDCHNQGDFSLIHQGLGLPVNLPNLTVLHNTANGGSAVVTEDSGCIVCHDGVGSSAAPASSVATRPYISAGEVHNGVSVPASCQKCHQADGTMISPAPALALNLTDTGGTCTDCHGAYFDNHTHHNGGGNQVAIDPLLDLSYAAPGQTCGNSSGASCHHDYSDNNGGQYPDMINWITIQWEHDRTDGTKDGDGACITCHNGDQPIRASNIDPAYVSPNDSIRGVVKTGSAVHCLTCHSDKVTPAVHGLDHIDHLLVNNTGQSTLGWPPIIPDAECVTCHVVVADYADDAEEIAVNAPNDVIIDMHNRNCGACHRSQPELKITPYDLSVFEQTDSVVGLPTPDGALCTECHQSGITISKTFHEMLSSEAQVIARHDLLGDSGSAPNGPADCLACHAEMVDASNVTEKLNRHQTCEKCHTASGLAVTVIADGSESATTPANQPCENCHNIKDDLIGGPGYRLHGLIGDAGPNGVADEHDNLADSGLSGDCSTSGCHAMGSFTEKIALHAQGCLTCHAPAALAIANPDPDGSVDALAQVDNGLPLSNDGYPAGSDLPVNCDDCHVQVGSFNMHGLDNPTAAPVHDKLAGSNTLSPGSAEDCETCHPAGTFETRLDLHTGGCAMCHGVATTPATTAISNGIAGTTINCETCHTGAGQYTMHGMDAAGSTGVHDKIQSLNTIPDVNCNQCHDMSTPQKIIELHTSPLNVDSTSAKDCLSCHLPGPSTADDVIKAGQGGAAGATQYCSGCHTGLNVYNMHGLAFDADTGAAHDQLDVSSNAGSGTKTDCAQCHSMGTPQIRLDMHAAVGCSICHNNGALYEPANSMITAAWDDTLPTPAKCEFCHTGTNYTNHSLTETDIPLQNMHEQLVDPVDVGVSSTCAASGCHDMTSLATKLAFHGTDDCLICHSSSQPAGVQTAISTGTTPGGSSPAPCEECHSTAGGLPNISYDWYLHADYTGGIDHSTIVLTPQGAGLSPSESCSSAACHGGVADTVVLHDSIVNGSSGEGQPYPECYECHAADGTLQPGTSDSYVAPSADCAECHGNYFDQHVLRTAGTNGHAGIDTSYYTPGLNEDWTADGAGCGACHSDATTINALWDMAIWNGVLYEHDLGVKDGLGACTICHDYNGTNGVNYNTVLGADATAAIAAVPENVTCGSCHDDKSQGGPTLGAESHGGHADNHFGWDGNCEICHRPSYPAAVDNATDAVVRVVHADDCTFCHTGSPETRDNDGIGGAHATTNGQDGDAFLADGSASYTTPFDQSVYVCTTCHPGGTYPSGPVHHDSAEWDTNVAGEACSNCHGARENHHNLTTAYTSFVPADDVSQASYSTANECDECHYDLTSAEKGTAALDTFVEILHEHDIQTGGMASETAKDNIGGCVTCHNYITDYAELTGDAGTPPQATVDLVVTYNTVAATSCVDCHTAKEQPNGKHGGHDAGADFLWTTASEQTCGDNGRSVAGSCHGNGTSKPDVVSDVHGATAFVPGRAYTEFSSSCAVCHQLDNYADGTSIGGILVNGYVGDARTTDRGGPANNGGPGSHDDTCMTCHGSDIPRIHHERNMTDSGGRGIAQATLDANGTQSNVQNGWCYLCHNDNNFTVGGVGQTNYDLWMPGGPSRPEVNRGLANATEQRPGKTPCAFCHFENETTSLNVWRIKKFDLNQIIGATTYDGTTLDSPILETGTYTHLIPNRGTDINLVNTGVCLYCHGDTGSRPVNYPYTGLKADGNPVFPRHAHNNALITGDETSQYEIPRLRVGIHPGHIRYRLMSTRPAPAGNTLGNAGWPMNDRFNKTGIWNVKIYQGEANTQAIGKDSGTITGTRFTTQWGISNLKALNGGAFNTGGTYAPVPTQVVPYTINQPNSYGNSVVPMNP